MIIFVISICITPDAFAKENTRLSLDPLPRQATAGEIITFSGKLTDVSGTGLIGGTIYIKDDDKWGPDDLIVKTVTEKNGKFKVSVIVKDWDRWSQDTEIYAVFEGTKGGKSGKSNAGKSIIIISCFTGACFATSSSFDMANTSSISSCNLLVVITARNTTKIAHVSTQVNILKFSSRKIWFGGLRSATTCLCIANSRCLPRQQLQF